MDVEKPKLDQEGFLVQALPVLVENPHHSGREADDPERSYRHRDQVDGTQVLVRPADHGEVTPQQALAVYFYAVELLEGIVGDGWVAHEDDDSHSSHCVANVDGFVDFWVVQS